ncbi:hypothetical protein M569_04587, partial [Genlisea aurea]
NGGNSKRKRRPAGTPDPDAEVVSLSPRTLLESDRYVCEICNQGFQRDQNLQMHRRRHKVPWKLLKRENHAPRKRVYVCPEPTCLHHDPCHALGDLVGIKKHFRRKHSNHRQWVCQKCSKGYAVQSDYKAHLKTCGTRGHSCDCGRVFSRVESFIEHQDACSMKRLRPDAPPVSVPMDVVEISRRPPPPPSLELQLYTGKYIAKFFLLISANLLEEDNSATQLQLSIGSSEIGEKSEAEEQTAVTTAAEEMMSMAMADKVYADEARQQAKSQMAAAEEEFSEAKKLRILAQMELEKAQALKENAAAQIGAAMAMFKCRSCMNNLRREAPSSSSSSSMELSYISAALRD